MDCSTPSEANAKCRDHHPYYLRTARPQAAPPAGAAAGPAAAAPSADIPAFEHTDKDAGRGIALDNFVDREIDTSDEKAEKQYQAKRIDTRPLDPNNKSGDANYVRGALRLEPDKLYELLERPDLLSAYRSRSLWRLGGGAVGGLGAAFSTLFTVGVFIDHNAGKNDRLDGAMGAPCEGNDPGEQICEMARGPGTRCQVVQPEGWVSENGKAPET